MSVVDDPNQTHGGHQQNAQVQEEKIKIKENPEPENLLNDRTSHGLVALAVPSSPDALIRSGTRPRHLGRFALKMEEEGAKKEEKFTECGSSRRRRS